MRTGGRLTALFAQALLSFVPSALAQPAVVGQWSAVQPWPVVSVHANLLTTGKVLFWDYSGISYLWDPATGAITVPAQPARNLFCAGQSTLADGKLFVPGDVGRHRRRREQ
jgi:hypothetical protein